MATAGLPNRALYSASKGAVLALTLAMAADLIADGIRVNAVNPGTADTPWVGRLLDAADDPAAERAALEARQPHGRLVSADEIADAIAYLAAAVGRLHHRRRAGGRRRHGRLAAAATDRWVLTCAESPGAPATRPRGAGGSSPTRARGRSTRPRWASGGRRSTS